MQSFDVSIKSSATLKRLSDADCMVFDGVTNLNYKDIIGDAEDWMSMVKNRNIAVITSQMIIIDLHQKKTSGISTWDMPSWEWDEYVTACEDESFYEQINRFLPFLSPQATKQEKLYAKYYLSGASARWMFGTTFDELPVEIERQLRKVRDKEILLSDISDTHCDGAVGHLTMVNSHNRTFLVSHYVTRKVAEAVNPLPN